MGTESFINKVRDSRSNSEGFPKFNKQAGDKELQSFIIRLMPKLKNKEIESPFAEFFMHNNCGPDGDQYFVCPNETKDDKKRNSKKCPQCAECKKIMRDQESYKESQVALAKKKYAGSKAYWPVYSLDTRKKIEILEVSKTGLDDILFEFGGGNTGDVFRDLTDLKSNMALKIIRKHSGKASEYKYKVVQDDKYKLTKEDIMNIRDSYLTPESCISRISAADIESIVYGEIEVSNNGGKDIEQNPSEPDSKPAAGDDAFDDLDDLDKADKGSKKEKEAPPARERSRSAEQTPPPARERSKAPEKADDSDDVMKELESMI